MTEVVAYRTANWDRPFWVNPNRRESRWTPAGSNLVVQYWSLHPLTPWAEVLRAQNVRDPVDAGSFYLRPWVGIIQLPADTVHLSFDAAPDHDLDPDALIDDDWSRCQNWVHAVRPAALVAPSAALPGTENLVCSVPRYGSATGSDRSTPVSRSPAILSPTSRSW